MSHYAARITDKGRVEVLNAMLAEAEAECDQWQKKVAELQGKIERGRSLVEAMDQRMPEQATEDEDGWINSYRIPVGPWHKLLGWARGG